ncbi:bsl4625 [Bradyrhizobium diazoefficiens USDA 110]|uniref:Bsl4625 protein n=1 Tax=Bradyrhizobium diazoefficiens (strain JCM 10833 / BCRC 13528 / IAM 13628 / NBRC 14792 / USDA 110) TaxID=224911 RepID=Q89LC0_BRADU|nr:hypothetical protein Bdiaspc4_24200 [Bradyrhizobium diazoefficiens]BAC49890.1 bsl4625 [Bradyrhizobium diazoefficiens USDA 110]
MRPASPNKALAAIPVTVADLIERRLRMADLLFALASLKVTEAASSGAAKK